MILKKGEKSVRSVSLVVLVVFLGTLTCASETQRWSEEKANEWYAQQPWLVGANYVPATAVNTIEMWQADTFDPQQMDKELGWAENAGMNMMRVFLPFIVWNQDAEGLRKRVDAFLTIASTHHISTMLVLFDSCFDPRPRLGPQHPPVPGVHNSAWVQSPGAEFLEDASQYPRLKAYVQGVVGAFGNDPRVVVWDLWNEPNNIFYPYAKFEPKDKARLELALLPKVFAWARSANPIQPLTSGLWQGGDWSSPEKLTPLERIQIEQSDVLSFHNYSWPEDWEQHVVWLEQYNRPIICTEFMARGIGSTFDTILPIAKRHHVGANAAALVYGKVQSYLPWESWDHPYILDEPPVWFHDIFYPDGRAYRPAEIRLLRELTGRPLVADKH
jgi:hypothetical protein